MSEGGVTAVEEALRIHPTWINGGMELPGPGGSRRSRPAGGRIRPVPSRPVLPHRLGVHLRRAGRRAVGADGPPCVDGPPDMRQWSAPFGAMSAANWIAINATQYIHRYGAPREMLGYIALNGRANAARNPAAIYREPMTMDDYLSARPITSPFGLYDCDVPCDASIAVIVSDASVAGDLPRPAVRIEAVGTQILERVSWDQGTLTHEPQVLGQSAHLWTRTHLRPADVDVALVYDGFTFNAISWLEALGFCGFGEAYEWLDGGTAHRPRRRAPGQSPRGSALRGPHPRIRVPLRGGHNSSATMRASARFAVRPRQSSRRAVARPRGYSSCNERTGERR